MPAPKLWTFEGETLPMREIAKRVPILKPNAIRAHLLAGRTTRVAMLSIDRAAAGKAGGRAAAKNRLTQITFGKQGGFVRPALFALVAAAGSLICFAAFVVVPWLERVAALAHQVNA